MLTFTKLSTKDPANSAAPLNNNHIRKISLLDRTTVLPKDQKLKHNYLFQTQNVGIIEDPPSPSPSKKYPSPTRCSQSPQRNKIISTWHQAQNDNSISSTQRQPNPKRQDSQQGQKGNKIQLIKSKIKHRLNLLIQKEELKREYRKGADIVGQSKTSRQPEGQERLLPSPIRKRKSRLELNPQYLDLKRSYIDYLQKFNPNTQRKPRKDTKKPEQQQEGAANNLLNIEKQELMGHVRPSPIKKEVFVTNLLEACAICPARLIRRPNTAELRPSSSHNTQRLVPILNQLLTSPQSPIQTFQPLSSQLFASKQQNFQADYSTNPNSTAYNGRSNSTNSQYYSPSKMYRSQYAKFLTSRKNAQQSMDMLASGEKQHERLSPWDIHEQQST